MAHSQKGEDPGTDLKKGLVNRSPDNPDSSMKCNGGSVNDGATRKDAAASPGSLGPRATGM